MENFEAILNKKEENSIEQNTLLQQYPEFFKDVGIEKVLEDGTHVFENEKITVSYKAEEISDEDLLSDEQLDLRLFFMQQNRSRRPILLEDHLKLIEFRIKNDTHEFDLKNEKNQPLILIKKDPEPDLVEGAAYQPLNLIVINSGPSSPQALLTLMHEYGHINDEKLPGELDRKAEIKNNAFFAGEYNETDEKETDAMTLRQERTAWAYALNKLRPHVDGFNIPEDSLDKYVHDFALGSYCKLMPEEY